ncbi:T9SS type A sorting domain-containing protein [Algibacter sp. PT7-4]|uniref:T9SS type A sorting domain-containing protein n=1 Tax=Algibacter ulvanivorans TaxID=3400999 RepID=UPI003AB0AC6C
MKTQLLYLFLFTSISFNGIAQSISVTSVDPDPSQVDNDLTINISYSTTNANDIIYIGLELKNSDGSWVASIAETTINPVGTSGTDIATSATIAVPASTVPSADLSGGQYYELKTELNMEAWAGWLAGDYPTMTLVGAPLAVEDFNNATISVYPNPVLDELNIKSTNAALQNKSYIITNVLGKVVAKKSKSESLQLINVSGLSKGLYFLQIDNLKPIKFLKQ